MRIDNHSHIGVDPLFYLQGWQPYCMDLTRHVMETEGAGIDAWVVFPFVSYMALDADSLWENRIQLSSREDRIPYQFENQRLCRELGSLEQGKRKRYLPFLIADPSRRTEEQVRSWEQLPKEYRVWGIKVQGTIIQSPVRGLLEQGRCILEYAQDHDIPLLIHTSIRPDDIWSQCSDVLDVVQRSPGVRFVLAHSCRFHHESLNRAAELPNAWVDCSAHVIQSTLAYRGYSGLAPEKDRFPSDYSSPETVLRDLAEAYPDKMIWGSDTPFYSIHYEHASFTSSYRREAACLDALPEDLQQKVSFTNTCAWLNADPADELQ